jgi:DNA-directed RNA polymerase subunit M/transcription elongation factor TFIIS
MSETPRTDKAIETLTDGFDFVSIDFARQLERESDQWREMAERLAKAEKCPNCDDVGWFTEWQRTRSGEPEPQQFQCEWCETVETSKFKALTAFEKLKGEGK